MSNVVQFPREPESEEIPEGWVLANYSNLLGGRVLVTLKHTASGQRRTIRAKTRPRAITILRIQIETQRRADALGKGQATAGILRQAGFSAEEIDALFDHKTSGG